MIHSDSAGWQASCYHVHELLNYREVTSRLSRWNEIRQQSQAKPLHVSFKTALKDGQPTPAHPTPDSNRMHFRPETQSQDQGRGDNIYLLVKETRWKRGRDGGRLFSTQAQALSVLGWYRPVAVCCVVVHSAVNKTSVSTNECTPGWKCLCDPWLPACSATPILSSSSSSFSSSSSSQHAVLLPRCVLRHCGQHCHVALGLSLFLSLFPSLSLYLFLSFYLSLSLAGFPSE